MISSYAARRGRNVWRLREGLLIRKFSEPVNSALGLMGLKVVRARNKRKWPFSTELVASSDGYWRLKSMPLPTELHRYYAAEYWASFRGTSQPEFLNARDLEHFDLLDQFGVLIPERQFVNFGSGHGGLSFLAAARGMNVLNVDPFSSPVWRGTHEAELPRDSSADVLYSSHSLEHVVEVKDVYDGFFATLKSGGLCLIEVPDLSRYWPHSKPEFSEPHTFYFSDEFFSQQTGGFSIELLRHRRRTRRKLPPYSTPGTRSDSDVLQVVLRKP